MLYDKEQGSEAPQEGLEPEAAPTKPIITIQVIRDNMEAEVLVQLTGPNTLNPAPEDLRAALTQKGVVRGIDENAVWKICNIPSYGEPVVVARGQPPQTGPDGSLNYLVETERELRPTLKEDGTADYKDLGFIQNVEKGQPLCEVIPPGKGEDGWDVLGNVLEGQYGRQPKSPEGRGTCYNQERTLLLAAVDGDVEVRRGTIMVQEVLKHPGNVDNSTGNIQFPGDVFIQGDVASGFTVQSGGSIVIKGTVEGARLLARGDISIGESVNGMDRAYIEAGGNLKCRYMQNCKIRCEETIYADSIMYCDLDCGGDVELSGRRAALIGGRSAIGGALSARTLGSESHPVTEIRMGVPSAAKQQEAEGLKTQIAQYDADIGKLAQVMARLEELAKQGGLRPEHKDTLLTVKDNYLAISTARKEAAARLEELQHELLVASAEASFVRCQGRVHSGVRLSFGPLNMVVQESFVRSRIGIVKEKIVISPL